MNIYEYINDPKLAPQTNRETKQAYMAKLNDIILREQKMPLCEIYTKGEEYWFYFKIPDAKLKNIKYDVVFQFTPKNDKDITSQSIGDYNVKFFSNDPGFMFYFCWVFNKEGLLIESLRSKCSNIALNQPPDKTNPERRIRMCKSFYFAYLVMEKLNLFNKEYIRMSGAKKFDQVSFYSKITADTAVKAKIDKTQKVVRFEKKVKKTVTKLPSEIEKKTNDIITAARTAMTKTTGVGKVSKTSKTTRTVGKAKTQKTIGRTRKH